MRFGTQTHKQAHTHIKNSIPKNTVEVIQWNDQMKYPIEYVRLVLMSALVFQESPASYMDSHANGDHYLRYGKLGILRRRHQDTMAGPESCCCSGNLIIIIFFILILIFFY